MRSPLPRRQTAASVRVPAPTGGWNARDPLPSMPLTDAIILTNMVNTSGNLQIRGGRAVWATCTNATSINTLAVWNGPSSSQLWAFADRTGNNLAFNVSTTGTKSSNADWDGFSRTTDNNLSTVMFNNVAGHYLCVADEDGVEPPAHYNGTNWVEPAITGVTAANLVHVNLFKYRLYFVEKDSLNIWYLPVDAIAGAAAKLPLGGYFNKGGYLLATGTWTVDGGEGSNDLFCAVSSRGQVAVFEGGDPSSSSSWSLVGVFDCALPLGARRCLSRYGADLVLLTEDGPFTLSQIMAGSLSQADAITDKIRGAFTGLARDHGTEHGWCGMHYPRGQYYFVNAPEVTSSGGTDPATVQLAMSTTTKTWSLLRGGGSCYALFGSRLYSGFRATTATARNRVFLLDDGMFDRDISDSSDVAIEVIAKQAFNDFGAPNQNKIAMLARPNFETDDVSLEFGMTITLELAIDYDYAQRALSTPATTTGNASLPSNPRHWEDVTIPSSVGTWNAGGAGVVRKAPFGRAVACSWACSVKNAKFAWLNTDWLIKPMTGLL